ncbi:unnamed protein product, partial [Prorocentrum cordatum]
EPPRHDGQLASTTSAWKEAEAQTQRLKLSVGLSPGSRLEKSMLETSPLLSRTRGSRASAPSWRASGAPETIAKIALENGRSESAEREQARQRADRLMSALFTLRRSNDPRPEELSLWPHLQ